MRTAHHGAAQRSSYLALAAVLLAIPAVVGTSTASASTPADQATPSVRGPSLLGRAVLPFYTFAEGPPAGGYVVPGTGEPGSGSSTASLPPAVAAGRRFLGDRRRSPSRRVPGDARQRLRRQGQLA